MTNQFKANSTFSVTNWVMTRQAITNVCVHMKENLGCERTKERLEGGRLGRVRKAAPNDFNLEWKKFIDRKKKFDIDKI